MSGECKFTEIRRQGIIKKTIKAKIEAFEDKVSAAKKPYLRLLLSQGNSKIVALAYGRNVENVKSQYQEMVHKASSFPSGTFRSELRDKKYPSTSTSKYDLIFEKVTLSSTDKSTSSASAVNDQEPSTSKGKVNQIQSALLRIAKQGSFTMTLKNIRFSGGQLYRYAGCETCKRSIPKPNTDGKYYCKSSCKARKGEGSRIGKLTKRRLFTMVEQVVILDDEDNGVINDVIIFPNQCETLLGNSADFDADELAEEKWKQLQNIKFNIVIERKNKKSKFTPSVFVGKNEQVSTYIINKVQPTSSKTLDNSDSDDDADDPEDFNFGSKKKKKERGIELVEIDMKLADHDDSLATLQRQKAKFQYHLRNKPPGLVLIINNMDFPLPTGYRKGSEMDVKKLRKSLVDCLGFSLFGDKSHKNIEDRTQLQELLAKFKDALASQEMESCLIVILSHGKDDEILLTGSNHETNTARLTEHVLLEFSEDNFPSFAGKPKIFIDATCQTFGKRESQNSFSSKAHKLYDMIVCFPSLPGYISKRKPDEGTVFIHHFVKSLLKHARNSDLVEILDITALDIKERIEKEGYTTSIPYHRKCAFGRFYFPIPTALQQQLVDESRESDKEEDMNVDTAD